MTKERNVAFDVMKGIAILLMVVGHCPVSHLLSRFIYSFHMPLFFLLSGMFFKSGGFGVDLQKGFRRLLVPYLLVGTLVVLISILRMNLLTFSQSGTSISLEQYQACWNALFWAGAVSIGDIPAIGSIWFLMALFMCRCLGSVLNNVKSRGVIAIAYLLWVTASPYVCLPLCMVSALGGLSFFMLGMHYRNLFVSLDKSKVVSAVLVVCWFVSMFLAKMDIGALHTGFPVVGWLGAVGGVYFVYRVSGYLAYRQLRLARWLSFLGVNSLLLLCIHKLDVAIIPYQKLYGLNLFPYWNYVIVLFRCVIAVSFTCCLYKKSLVRKIF